MQQFIFLFIRIAGMVILRVINVFNSKQRIKSWNENNSKNSINNCKKEDDINNK